MKKLTKICLCLLMAVIMVGNQSSTVIADEDYSNSEYWLNRCTNYGKDDADFNYKQAQKAVKNSEGYAKKLVEVQDIDKVDSVSGATISYKRFKSAVKDALNK